MRIACLGPEESYSALAAKRFDPNAEIVCFRTFSYVADALSAKKTDAAVFPIENSINGGVVQNLDILQSSADFYACAELILPIDHRLVTKTGVRSSDIRTIYSHEQAFGQCREYLKKHFPDARCIYTESTAASLKLLDGASAGIVGAHIDKAGFVLSDGNIADEPCNQTHFLLVKRGMENLPVHSDKIFVCVRLLHRSGSLLAFLQSVAAYRLNLTKIESRPASHTLGEYNFFLEFEGDIGDGEKQAALEILKRNSLTYRLLGAY